MKNIAFAGISLLGLIGCGGSSTSVYQADGLQAVLGQQVFQGSDFLAAGNTGYTYQIGLNSSETRLAAEADLTATSTLPDPPKTGTATMRGPFQLRGYINPNISTGALLATGISRNGTLEATVDFDDATLTAEDGLGAAAFTVDGKFDSEGTLRGSTEFQGIRGTLGGDVSATEAIGVFEGSDSSGVFAGGFVVSE